MSAHKPNLTHGRRVLDLTKTRFETTKHGIRVIGTWYYNEDKGDHDPCLVLVPANRPLRRGKVKPVIIPIDEGWRWALHAGIGDPLHCATSADEWMGEGLLPGTPGDKNDRMRILDAIQSRLRDLLMMPPRPAGDLITLGTATLLDPATGEVMLEEDYKADV